MGISRAKCTIGSQVRDNHPTFIMKTCTVFYCIKTAQSVINGLIPRHWEWAMLTDEVQAKANHLI